MEDLLAKAAEAMKMPEAMVRRSAEARAKAEGRAIEEVLADWAGVKPPDAAASEPEAETAATEPTEAEPAKEQPVEREAEPAEKAPATGIDRYVEAAAEKMKMPASMVRRSAEARARAENRTYEEVLADWAGADVDEVRAAAEEAEGAERGEAEQVEADEAEAGASPEEEPDAEEPSEDEEAAEEPSDEEPEVEVIGGEEEQPAEEEPSEEEPAEEELVGAGVGLPRWLLSLFVVVPAFAIGYAAFFPNGPNCGDAGRLAVDPVTGVAVSCDGSAYGERVTDFLAMGSQTYAVCAGCHGAGGGGGAGPPFTGGGIMATFPEGQCETHVEWVRLGTAGWPDPAYGATEKPVGGFGAPMPAFGSILTEEELRAVALFERVQFGGQDLTVALGDCGLADPGEDGSLDGG